MSCNPKSSTQRQCRSDYCSESWLLVRQMDWQLERHSATLLEQYWVRDLGHEWANPLESWMVQLLVSSLAFALARALAHDLVYGREQMMVPVSAPYSVQHWESMLVQTSVHWMEHWLVHHLVYWMVCALAQQWVLHLVKRSEFVSVLRSVKCSD